MQGERSVDSACFFIVKIFVIFLLCDERMVVYGKMVC